MVPPRVLTSANVITSRKSVAAVHGTPSPVHRRKVVPDFGELDAVVLAYATTIHKAQGSEYAIVVLVLTTKHYVMLERRPIYTGITWGKRLVVVIGQKKALWIAVKGKATRRGWSKLRELLVGEIKGTLPRRADASVSAATA